MTVPFLDLKAHHEPLKGEFMKAIEEVVDAGAFAGGRYVDTFENEFADYCTTKHAAGVGSGTEALWIVLKAMDIGPGDEVITVPSTFFATAEAISQTGATPVFVDVCEETCNMDPAALKKAITSQTKAIIPVHLFGQPADMDPILKIARAKGIYVIEDAAQAHGAEYKGRRAGSMGDAGCFSFYPGKNLGAFGEAGAVVTNNPEIDKKVRMLRDHGQSRKYHHDLIGWNARMDGIQAAVLSIKLKHLERSIELRNENALRYSRTLRNIKGITLPHSMADVRHVWHLYVIRVANRNEVIRQMGERDVSCGIHYPVPVHLLEAYKNLPYQKSDFPIAEKCADEFVSLPMFPELTEAQIDYAVKQLREVI